MTEEYNPDEDARRSYDVAISAMRRKVVTDEYDQFLRTKATVAPACGFDPVLPMPKAVKTFQRDIIAWACRRGRAAIFAGTGLGKTLMELTWAANVVAKTNGRVLIFTPLAVAEQTVGEAAKFGIPDVAYAADEDSIETSIVVTNYDRREKFDLSQFAGVVCDESGILKDHDSRTRIDLTEACRDVPYILCGSATPAPNDWTELGQHAEFLGVMSAKEMLAMFFVHDGAVRANAGEDDWRLKSHAKRDFWKWVASWSVMIRHPRDLGYDDQGYDLPPLKVHQVKVASNEEAPEGMLFAMEARTLQERLAARKVSVTDRVNAAAEIVRQKPDEPWLVWCNLNAEADAVAKAIGDAVNVQGSDPVKQKVAALRGFQTGDVRVLVSKPSIAGRGMNFQRCANVVFVGLNDSFEQLFQAVRRCWRFGQTREVNCYLIASELEGAVAANLQAKERKYEEMAAAMVEHMADLSKTNLSGGRNAVSIYTPSKKMEVPAWLR